MKVMRVRLADDDQARGLALVARVDGMSDADVVRKALDSYLRSRRGDPGFQVRLRECIQADQDALRQIEGRLA